MTALWLFAFASLGSLYCIYKITYKINHLSLILYLPGAHVLTSVVLRLPKKKIQEHACVADEDCTLCIQVYTPMEGVPERMGPVIPSSGKRRLHTEGSLLGDSPIEGVKGQMGRQVSLNLLSGTCVMQTGCRHINT